MKNEQNDISIKINNIRNLIGNKNEVIIREFIIGKINYVEMAVIYINGLVNKDIIDRDVLNPLMLHIDEDLSCISDIEKYIYKKYITVSNTQIEGDINKAVESVKRGKTVLVIDGVNNLIVLDTTGGIYRTIEEPANDVSLKGSREGFVENLEINVSMLQRRIKDKNLVTEKFTLGVRSQTDLVVMYIDDVVDKEYLQKLRDKLSKINIDSISENSIVEQFIEEHTHSIFPQAFATERPDVVESNLMEGRIAFILAGTPSVTTYPATFFQFFQTPEDYFGRSLQAFVIRMLRIIAVFIVTSFPAIYITFIKFNAELIPLEFIKSLIQSRKGIALTPFMSLLAMQVTIELLREGGLRMPNKIGQTLSVVGGIIIGDAALKAKVVSSTTLLVAGSATIASFAISNYQMAIAIRLVAYPMLVLANWLGVVGIVIGWFFLLAYLCSMENLGVPYFSFHKSDFKDIFVRVPMPNMKKRNETVPQNNPIRQGDSGSEKNE